MGKINGWLQRSSILRLLWTGFILLILLPFSLVTVILTVQSYSFAVEEGQKNDANTLDVIKSSITAEARRVEDLATSIATNASLLDILQPNNRLTGEYYEKYLSASRFISESSTSFGSPYTLRINLFLKSDDINIYEGFGRFYRIARVEGQAWYEQFAQSGRTGMWLRLDRDGYYRRYDVVGTRGEYTFALVRSIISYTGAKLGVLVIEVPDKLLITQYGIDDVFVQCSQSGELLYSPRADVLELVGGQAALTELPSGRMLSGEYECLIDDFIDMQLRIGIVHSSLWISRLLGENMVMYILLMALLLVLILLFTVLLRYITHSLSQCIRSIEAAICGDEPSLLPEDSRGEIGQLVSTFNMLSARVRSMIAERVALETATQNAQIHEMQARLSPHFFYNTLDVLSSTMLLAGQVEIAEAVADFGQMMRYSFRNERETTLGAELRCVRSYINLQKMRYHDRIELTIDVPPALEDTPCMKFILQPVVENSIRHGMLPDERTLHISIRTLRRDGDVLEVVVQDDGVGMDEVQLEQLRQRLCGVYQGESDGMSFGVGLYNVNNQLVLSYGSRYSLSIDSRPDRGTAIYLPILAREGAKNAENTAGR